MFRFMKKKTHTHDLAAASSSRNIATEALLDTLMSDSNLSIQFANELRRWNSEIYEYKTT